MGRRVAENVIKPLKKLDILIADRKIPDDFQKDLESMEFVLLLHNY